LRHKAPMIETAATAAPEALEYGKAFRFSVAPMMDWTESLA